MREGTSGRTDDGGAETTARIVAYQVRGVNSRIILETQTMADPESHNEVSSVQQSHSLSWTGFNNKTNRRTSEGWP